MSMDVLGFFSPFGLFFLAVPLMFGIGIWLHQRRIKAAQQFAASIGWSYVGNDASLRSRWSGAPFGAGHSRRVSEVMTGIFQGRTAVSFAYQYTTGSGKESNTYSFHVVALRSPAYLPMLEITPDGVGAKLAKVFGGEDIRFESEAFNRAWRIRAGNPRFAHDVIQPRLMERLLRPDAQGLSLRIEGVDLLCWTGGMPRYEDLARRLHVADAVLDSVPRFVWLDHGYDPGQG